MKVLLLLFLLILIAYSCKKEELNNPPYTSITNEAQVLSLCYANNSSLGGMNVKDGLNVSIFSDTKKLVILVCVNGIKDAAQRDAFLNELGFFANTLLISSPINIKFFKKVSKIETGDNVTLEYNMNDLEKSSFLPTRGNDIYNSSNLSYHLSDSVKYNHNDKIIIEKKMSEKNRLNVVLP